MTEPSGPLGSQAVVQRLIEAQLRYYRALNQVTSEYLNTVLGSIQNVPGTSLGPNINLTPNATTSSGAGSHVHSPVPAQSRSSAPAVVLEAAAGETAMGVFLVENRMGQRIDTPIVASVLTDPTGREVRLDLLLDPAEISLEEGEQVLVRVGVSIGEELQPGTDYRGDLAVPGLPGSQVRLVVRRRDDPGMLETTTRSPRSSTTGGPARSRAPDVASERPKELGEYRDFEHS